MIASRWQQMESLFHSALDRDPSERDSYLEEVCGGDEELLREVKALLAGNEHTSFLKHDVATEALSALDKRSALKPGERLGPYEIETHHASGGMGMVYRAQDTRLNRAVAVKVLRRASAGSESRARLKREAQSIAMLQHPHICSLFDMGEQDGRDYLVMEFLGGETLANRIARGALPLVQALEYATQIAAALEAAHRRGIVHRDVKPGNVMITKSGAKLLDFGLASLQESFGEAALERTSSALTISGRRMGTLAYMAPEQSTEAP